MGSVIRFDQARRAGADAFCAGFLAFVHGEPGCAQVQEAQVRALARYAFEASRGGVRWLDLWPHELFLAALPEEESSRAELERAEALCLAFLRFLVVTRRLSAEEAAFLEGWVRSARRLVLDVLLQEAELSLQTPRKPAPGAPSH